MEPKEITNLEETVQPMLSKDWADRLIAEYYQLKFRLENLKKFIGKDKFKSLDDHERTLLIAQTGYMQGYLKILRERLLSLSEPLPAA